ncbi:MAG: hypothetical protein FWF94_04550 [Oscillospiraceae bacterium]|nr:hypothetical protein [Oscillospiraceae bacterium]
MDNKKNKTLHGNAARIDPKKKVAPLFEMSETNGYRGVGVYGTNAFSRAYNRLDFDEEAGIQEVDSNPLS